MARAGHATFLGRRHVRPRALDVVPRHQKILGIRRMNMSNFSRHLGIYNALWKNSVAREMSFKGNFLLWIVVELLWFGLQLCFIGVLYLHVNTIGTWTQWQYVLLV